MNTLAFLPIFCCCLLVADAQQSSVGTTLRGLVEGDSYRNDYFGFTYKLPAGFENAPDQLQKGFIQGLQTSNPGSELLLMIVRPESAASIPDIIVVTTIPQRPSSRDGLNQALDYFRTKRLKYPQKEGLRADHPINLGGVQFAREDLKDPGLGQSSAEIALVIKEQLLNFAIYTASQQRLEQVAAELIQSVTFDSAAPSKKGHPNK
jgi:hypothetical protein